MHCQCVNGVDPQASTERGIRAQVAYFEIDLYYQQSYTKKTLILNLSIPSLQPRYWLYLGTAKL